MKDLQIHIFMVTDMKALIIYYIILQIKNKYK
jgi:hypothetical protein